MIELNVFSRLKTKIQQCCRGKNKLILLINQSHNTLINIIIKIIKMWKTVKY